MMKTNWNSTWPVIYQSPAAKLVPFACEGIQPVSLRRLLHAPRRPGEGEIREIQRKTSRKGRDFRKIITFFLETSRKKPAETGMRQQ